jgi:GGDEF domain-containing protein
VAGLGGGEFALLLPETGDDATRGLVGRSREALPEAINRNQSPVGFSVAVRVCAAAPPDIDIMINTADQLMYGARTSATNSTRSSLSAG